MSSGKMETNHRILLAVLVVAAAADLVGHAAAATYTVGDTLGWRIPPDGSTYENWSSQHVFRAGDVLVFEFATGTHDVAKVTENSYSTCSGTNPISIFTTGPAVNVILNATGDHYFLCTLGRHCSLGQKLAVRVTGNSSTGQPPAPSRSPSAPTPTRSPSVPNPPPPPGSDSGPTVTIGSCNMLVVIFVSILVAGILI